MKKLLFGLSLLLSLTQCTDPGEILPRDSNLEDVDVLGGALFAPGSEISLSISLQNLPKENNWFAVWEINGTEMHRVSLANSSKSRVEFYRFSSVDPGNYSFSGCIVSGSVKVCRESNFSIK